MRTCFLVALLFAYSCCNGIHYYDTGDFHVIVTGEGNVPKYTYYLKDDSDNRYSIRFDSLYECQGTDTADNCPGRAGNIALSSLRWVWSDLVQKDNDTSYFDFNGTSSRFDQFHVRNYLHKGNDSVKFDVVIKNYHWASPHTDSLVLTFVHSGKKGDYFHVEDTANNGTVSVKLSEKGNKKYVSYERFSTRDLVHDPEFGINSASTLCGTASLILSVFSLLFVL